MARINLLLPDQALELRALTSAVSSLPDAQRGCRFLASKVAVILDVSAAIVEKRRGEWFVRAAAGAPPQREIMAEAAVRADSIVASGHAVAGVQIAGHQWTAASLLRGERARMLLISGDWTLSESLLQSIGAELGAALGRLVKSVRRPAGRGMAEAWTLPRRLAVAADGTHLQMIIDACAKAVAAESGSLALYDDEQQTLSVSATFGYPAALVKYLRFRAGEGIIGSVYRSGRTMLMEDVRQIKGGRSPRLRYRTSSFMCVPLLGANRVLGVISVADRRDRQPFDRINLRNLRMIAGVASLVLERASALHAAKIKEGEAAVNPLTGLFNRRSFRKRLNEEVERARRHGSPLSLTMVDVDNFKRLNDHLGHLVGDSALRLVANVLQQWVRLFDTSARVGGDEFAILMPGSGLDSSRHIAQRIRESIEEARPPGQQWSEDASVTVSMGIATLTDTTADEFVDRADRALYMAKRDGKNCVRWWEEPPAPSEGARAG